MATKSKKKVVVAATALAMITMTLFAYVLPGLVEQVLTSKLRSVYAEQEKIFEPSLSALVNESPSKTISQCYQEKRSYTKTLSYCQNFQIYKYNTLPVPVNAKSSIVAAANQLDTLLTKNGWAPDRPQDQITTIAKAVTTSSNAQSRNSMVPYHKNIGAISCNLVVDASGSTDDDPVGTININSFSCQQHIQYFMPHLRNFKSSGGV